MLFTGDLINDGQELWNNLISLHSNVRVVLCDHCYYAGGYGYGYRMDSNAGVDCLQLWSDWLEYQYGHGILVEIDLDVDNDQVLYRTFDTVNADLVSKVGASSNIPLRLSTTNMKLVDNTFFTRDASRCTTLGRTRTPIPRTPRDSRAVLTRLQVRESPRATRYL